MIIIIYTIMTCLMFLLLEFANRNDPNYQEMSSSLQLLVFAVTAVLWPFSGFISIAIKIILNNFPESDAAKFIEEANTNFIKESQEKE